MAMESEEGYSDSTVQYYYDILVKGREHMSRDEYAQASDTYRRLLGGSPPPKLRARAERLKEEADEFRRRNRGGYISSFKQPLYSSGFLVRI